GGGRSGRGGASRDAKGDEDAVTSGHDRADEPVVAGDQLVVLEDRARVAVGVGPDDPARPQHVVADVQAADADPLATGPPGVRVPVLVDVVVDDVEVAVDPGPLLDRVADVVRHAIPHAGAGQIALGLLGVVRVTVGAVHLAAFADRT